MICHKCSTKGVYNEVFGKGFFYCRTCKDEILPQEAPVGVDLAASQGGPEGIRCADPSCRICQGIRSR